MMEAHKEDPDIFTIGEYRYAMDFIQDVLKTEASVEDQLIIVNFMLDVVKEDLKMDLLSYIFYSKEDFSREINWPFPVKYRDEIDNELSIEEGAAEVDLTQNCVLVLPWSRNRLCNQIVNIFKNDFCYDERNHKAWYFPYISLCYVHNGRHSVASGVVHKKGKIKAQQYDITKLFSHIYTDGQNWYSSHNNNNLGRLVDFRLGIIYEIAKVKHKLEQTAL